MVTILNVSTYALTCKYIVARFVDDEWWYYGAWNDADRAYAAALAEDGQVFKTEEIDAEVWG